jgi:hypothetical protein
MNACQQPYGSCEFLARQTLLTSGLSILVLVVSYFAWFALFLCLTIVVLIAKTTFTFGRCVEANNI